MTDAIVSSAGTGVTAPLTIVSYNIQFCRGRDGRFDLDRIARALDGADIVLLQEVERHWRRSGAADQVAGLAAAFPGFDWAYGPTVEFRGDPSAPADTPRRQFGNMTLSRWPMEQVRRHLLPKHRAVANRFAIQRGLLDCIVPTPFGRLRVLNTHLDHLGTPARLDQIAFILRTIADGPIQGGVATGGETDPDWQDLWAETAAIAEVPAAAILGGDLNAEPGSPELSALTAGVPVSLVECDALGRGSPTFFTDWESRLGKRIDHVLITPDLKDRVASVTVDADADGSDHQPLWVRLAFDGAGLDNSAPSSPHA